MFNKKIITISVACSVLFFSSFSQGEESSIDMDIDSSSDVTGDFKDRMKELREQELLMQQKSRIEELRGQMNESKGSDQSAQIEELQGQVEKLEGRVSQLQSINDQLSAQLKDMKDPNTLNNIQNHIYVTRIDQFGQNKYAEIFHDFHYSDYQVGETITDGVTLAGINDRSIEIKTDEGETHTIKRTTIDRAMQEALSAREGGSQSQGQQMPSGPEQGQQPSQGQPPQSQGQEGPTFWDQQREDGGGVPQDLPENAEEVDAPFPQD